MFLSVYLDGALLLMPLKIFLGFFNQLLFFFLGDLNAIERSCINIMKLTLNPEVTSQKYIQVYGTSYQKCGLFVCHLAVDAEKIFELGRTLSFLEGGYFLFSTVPFVSCKVVPAARSLL